MPDGMRGKASICATARIARRFDWEVFHRKSKKQSARRPERLYGTGAIGRPPFTHRIVVAKRRQPRTYGRSFRRLILQRTVILIAYATLQAHGMRSLRWLMFRRFSETKDGDFRNG